MLPTSQQKELKSHQLPDSFEASRTTNHQLVIQEWPEIPSFSSFIFTLIVFWPQWSSVSRIHLIAVVYPYIRI